MEEPVRAGAVSDVMEAGCDMPSADSMFRRTIRHAGVLDRQARASENRYDDVLARVAAKRAGVPFFRLDELLPESTEGDSSPQDSDAPSGVVEAVATHVR